MSCALPSITQWSGVGICCIMPLQNSLIVSMLSLKWMRSLSGCFSSSSSPSFSLLRSLSASLTPLSTAEEAGTESDIFLSAVRASWFSECDFPIVSEKMSSGLWSSPFSAASELMEHGRTMWKARLFDLRQVVEKQITESASNLDNSFSLLFLTNLEENVYFFFYSKISLVSSLLLWGHLYTFQTRTD